MESKILRAGAVSLAALLLVSCSGEESSVPAPPPLLTTAATTTQPATTTAPPYVPQRQEAEWGWYEIQLPEYEGWILEGNGMDARLVEANPKLQSFTKKVSLNWDYENQCLVHYSYTYDKNNQPIQVMDEKPAVIVEMKEWPSLDGQTSVSLPAYADIHEFPEQLRQLYPEYLLDAAELMTSQYIDRWGEIRDYFHGEPEQFLPGYVMADGLEDYLYASNDTFMQHWRIPLMYMIYNNPYTYNVIDTKGIHYDVAYSAHTGLASALVPQYSMAQEEYEASLPQFKEIWEKYMADISRQTEGCSVMQTAFITAVDICSRCAYDQTQTRRTARDGLTQSSINCMGYTQWFNCVMNELGIKAVPVSSQALEHVWSAVYIPEEQRWAEIDVTWMDAKYLAAGAQNDYLNMMYFDFNSADQRMFPNHYCTDQESIIPLLKEPAPTQHLAEGYGYSFPKPVNLYCNSAKYNGNGTFTLGWSNGTTTTLTVR